LAKLSSLRKQVVIATKLGFDINPDGSRGQGNEQRARAHQAGSGRLAQAPEKPMSSISFTSTR